MNNLGVMSGLLGSLHRLRSIVRSRSATAEFFVILAIGFGPLIAFETLSADFAKTELLASEFLYLSG